MPLKSCTAVHLSRTFLRMCQNCATCFPVVPLYLDFGTESGRFSSAWRQKLTISIAKTHADLNPKQKFCQPVVCMTDRTSWKVGRFTSAQIHLEQHISCRTARALKKRRVYCTRELCRDEQSSRTVLVFSHQTFSDVSQRQHGRHTRTPWAYGVRFNARFLSLINNSYWAVDTPL